MTRADADSFITKLEAFRTGLPSGEQQILDSTLRVLEDRAKEPSVQGLLADFPDGPELLEDVAGFAIERPGEEQHIVTAVTLVTLVTTKA